MLSLPGPEDLYLTLHGQLSPYQPTCQAPLRGLFLRTVHSCQAIEVLSREERASKEFLLELPVLLEQSPHVLPQLLQLENRAKGKKQDKKQTNKKSQPGKG